MLNTVTQILVHFHDPLLQDLNNYYKNRGPLRLYEVTCGE